MKKKETLLERKERLTRDSKERIPPPANTEPLSEFHVATADGTTVLLNYAALHEQDLQQTRAGTSFRVNHTISGVFRSLRPLLFFLPWKPETHSFNPSLMSSTITTKLQPVTTLQHTSTFACELSRYATTLDKRIKFILTIGIYSCPKKTGKHCESIFCNNLLNQYC